MLTKIINLNIFEVRDFRHISNILAKHVFFIVPECLVIIKTVSLFICYCVIVALLWDVFLPTVKNNIEWVEVQTA